MLNPDAGATFLNVKLPSTPVISVLSWAPSINSTVAPATGVYPSGMKTCPLTLASVESVRSFVTCWPS